MSLGLVALLFAGLAAGWLLLRIARGQNAGANANINALKIVIWLGLVAVLFAARLWPLAFMVLVAAGSVMGIEMWRANAIAEDAANSVPKSATTSVMAADEALAVLGLDNEASAEEIRSAHKKLISQIHPDKGGTDYLAAKINQARDLLLGALDK